MVARAPSTKRKFFPVADGIVEHLAWISGARLAVYLVVLRRTKYRNVWRGWTVDELADEAKLSRTATLDALRALSKPSPEPVNPARGIGRRAYLRLVLGRGRRPNEVSVLHSIRESKDRGRTVENSADNSNG